MAERRLQMPWQRIASKLYQTHLGICSAQSEATLGFLEVVGGTANLLLRTIQCLQPVGERARVAHFFKDAENPLEVQHPGTEAGRAAVAIVQVNMLEISPAALESFIDV